MSDTSKRNLLIALVLVVIAFFALRPKRATVETPIETGKPYTEIPTAETPAAEMPKPAPTEKVGPPPATTKPLPVGPSLPMDKIQALRSQARAHLSAGYTAQRAFRAEFGRYTTDLKAMGWSPTSANVAFKFGFLTEFRPNLSNDPPMDIVEDPRLMSTDSFIGDRFDDNSTFRYDDSANNLALSEYSRFCSDGCTADDDSFEMLLAVPLGDPDHVDVWIVNEKKQMEMVFDGVTGQAPERPQQPAGDPSNEVVQPGPNPQTISR